MRFVLTCFVLSALVLGGCAAEAPDAGTSDTSALTAPASAFVPYVSQDEVNRRVAIFQERNGADWQAVDTFGRRRFIASTGTMKTTSAVGPQKTLTKDEARAVARAFFTKNADLLSIDASRIDANLEVYKTSDGMGGGTYLGWGVGLKTPAPPMPFESDETGYNSRLWVDIEVDGVIHELKDVPERMPVTAFDLRAPHDALDAEMTRSFLGKHVVKTGLECDESTLRLVTVTHDYGTIGEADLEIVTLLRSIPKADGIEVRLAYEYRLARFSYEYAVDATTAEVFRAWEPDQLFGSFGACW